MAKAERKTERRVITEETITLTLSPDEAAALRAVLRRVTGSDTNSPRKHTSAIASALQDQAGISSHVEIHMLAGTLRFANYPEERQVSPLDALGALYEREAKSWGRIG